MLQEQGLLPKVFIYNSLTSPPIAPGSTSSLRRRSITMPLEQHAWGWHEKMDRMIDTWNQRSWCVVSCMLKGLFVIKTCQRSKKTADPSASWNDLFMLEQFQWRHGKKTQSSELGWGRSYSTLPPQQIKHRKSWYSKSKKTHISWKK